MTRPLSLTQIFPRAQRGVATLLMISCAFVTQTIWLDHANAQTASKLVQSARSAAGQTRMIVLDAVPSGDYTVQKNGSNIATVIGSPAGSIAFNTGTVVGDRITLINNGAVPVDPSTPGSFSGTGGDDGCATLAWSTPPIGEYVSDYEISWGTAGGNRPNVVTFAANSTVTQGATTYYTFCGLPSGVLYVTLRAHNQFDRWSGRTPEISLTVSNGNTQGPATPQNFSAAQASGDFGCVSASWSAVGDPTVTGYRLYYGTSSRAYSDSIDAGTSISRKICGLNDGTYYFSARSYTSNGLLSTYSSESSVSVLGVDSEGPLVLSPSPADGAVNIPRNVVLAFVITDGKSGVDRNSIAVTIEGASAPFSVLGYPTSYIVQVQSTVDLPANTIIDVVVDVDDLASTVNHTQFLWSFTTNDQSPIDTTPPSIAAVSPMPGQDGVAEGADVVVEIYDAGLGINFSSIEFYINDSPVAYAIEGDQYSTTLRYVNEAGFGAGSPVTVRIEACDQSTPRNCATSLQYSFSVVENYYAGLANGAIVPNGFWANEPQRPLEVRNLPLNWTVRIFDTAGGEVRRFRNIDRDGYNWAWDFANNHAQQVARAIYVVRVTDDTGNVRQRGRFLVQMDP